MNRDSAHPRRLRVSALAAVANPSYTRLDTWNLLDDACRHLSEVDRAGLGIDHDVSRVRRLMDRLAAYERYWLYPGAHHLATFHEHLEALSTVRLAEEVSLAVRLLSEYGDRAGLFDTSAPLAEQELVAQAKRQQFYTVLLADDAPSTAPDCLAECLQALRNPSDDVQYELLVVTSIEDAITAVALNGEIQAAIIRHDLPLRSHDRVPLMNTLLGAAGDDVVTKDAQDWVECAQWIRELRPHIDLYLLTDESIAADTQDEADVYDRTFYRLNDVTDLNSTVLAGLKNRFATPFFDALCAYAAAPVGQFHALPVARGASIFNSKSLQDMGEFYGRNIFMAETSTTSGRHRPHRPQLPQVTPLRPGARRGLPAVPGRLSAARVRDLRRGVAAHDQEGAPGPRGRRAVAAGAHAAAHQLHLRRRRLQPAPRDGGGAGDQAGHLLSVGRGVVCVRDRGAVGPAADRDGVRRAPRADAGVPGIRCGVPGLGRVDGGCRPVGVG